jgi:hypothetical protein
VDKISNNFNFEPNPKQIKFAELYLDFDKKLTKKDIAMEIGITDRTVVNWFKNPGFVDWINSKKDEILNKSLMARYRIAIRKASQGDFQFSKLLFEMTGEYVQKTESRVTNVYEDYEKMSDEEIIREFERELNGLRIARTQKINREDNIPKKTKS